MRLVERGMAGHSRPFRLMRQSARIQLCKRFATHFGSMGSGPLEERVEERANLPLGVITCAFPESNRNTEEFVRFREVELWQRKRQGTPSRFKIGRGLRQGVVTATTVDRGPWTVVRRAVWGQDGLTHPRLYRLARQLHRSITIPDGCVAENQLSGSQILKSTQTSPPGGILPQLHPTMEKCSQEPAPNGRNRKIDSSPPVVSADKHETGHF